MSKVDNEVKKSMLKTKTITLISAIAAILFIQIEASIKMMTWNIAK